MNPHVKWNALARWMMCAGALLAPTVVFAHVGAGQTSGFMSGQVHPVTGIDHVAAMMAVGLWAAQSGGKAVWGLPLCFMVAMAVGGALGGFGISIPFAEVGIAASVLVLGLFIATAVRLPWVAGSVLAGLFAVFHGHAHGAEMPGAVSGLSYGMGFVLATGLLHGIGIGCGLLARRLTGTRVVRHAGGAVAALGLYLLVA